MQMEQRKQDGLKQEGIAIMQIQTERLRKVLLNCHMVNPEKRKPIILTPIIV